MKFDRLTVVHAGLVLFLIALLGRAAQLQLKEGATWAAQAKRQHYTPAALPAVRGPILDATGAVLVESRELTRLSVAPHEARDLDALVRALQRVGVARATLKRLRDPRRRWIDIPGAFAPADVATLVALRGVYARPVVDRVYVPSGGVRRLVGRLDASGEPLDGLELVLDSLLRGDSARMRLPRDRSGRAMAGIVGQATVPHPGATVTLTINKTLQDICERALAQSVDSLDASGGDVVVMNPHTGEILAMASQRSNKAATANTAISEPFEPGSTLKPFVAASLLALGRARAEEQIATYDGLLRLEGRTIRDVHKAEALTLVDVIRHSSNVGIVRFSERLSPREKYELFRDLGFGVPTGIPLPAEASGTLREPKAWSRQSAASLMMGYEIAVTPLQLAAAYASLANGGVLMEPQLVKEIRDADGEVLFRTRPRQLRRVFTREAASAARAMLLGVVEGGTAMKADLATYRVGGKSGTARRVQGGRYAPGLYTASFVGLFPGDDPQYVILVKLDDPQRAIYGGETAAPLTRVVLQAALAARDAALDRGLLASAGRETVDSFFGARNGGDRLQATARAGEPRPAPAQPVALDVATVAETVAAVPSTRSAAATPARERARVFRIPYAPSTRQPPLPPRAVPDVEGAPVRDAVRALHEAGFKVTVRRGSSSHVTPTPGTLLEAGALVHLSVKQ